MGASSSNRTIHIQGNVAGSSIISGDGNTIYVINQATELQHEETFAPAAADIGLNPYKGLAAFDENDAQHYFGREAQVERLWQRFQTLAEQPVYSAPRLLPIIGPSGCGKSSLAKAGFIPELARRTLLGKAHTRVMVLVPGAHPLQALAGVLARSVTGTTLPLDKAEEFERILKTPNEAGEYKGLSRIADLLPDSRQTALVILVDQFEEIYSLCKNLADRQAFVDNLLQAASTPMGSLLVVMTLRSDFLSETQSHERLNQVIGSDRSLIVPAMAAAELRRAVAEPAKRAGHPFDEAMVDLLVKETEGREGALPLLQFALTRLWEGWRQGRSPTTTYREIGGVGGALAGKAQAMYNQLTQAEQAIAQRIFVGLTQVGEGARDTRRRVEIDRLMASQENPETFRRVINYFAAPSARLITLSRHEGYETAEVAHEALFSHWRLLIDWIEDNRDDIRFQRRLESAATYWDRHNRPDGLLWRSPDLTLLKSFERRSPQTMTQLSTAFFVASDRAQKHENRRQIWGTVGLIAGLAMTSTLSIFSGYKVYQAGHRQIVLYAQRATDLASTDKIESSMYGLAALGKARSPLMRLFSIGQEDWVTLAILDRPNRGVQPDYIASHSEWVSAVAFSPDEKLTVSGGGDNVLRLWDEQGHPVGRPFEGHRDAITAVAFSPNGKIIASGSRDRTIRLWDLQGNPIGGPFQGHADEVQAVAFSPDGAQIVSGSRDRTIRLWDLQGNPVGDPFQGHADEVATVAVSPDGQAIVSGSLDGTLRLWDLQGNPVGKPFQGHTDWVKAVAFSPDGKRIVSGSGDKTLRLWDLQGNLIGKPFEGHQDYVVAVAFSPDGQRIVSGSEDETVRLWDLQGNQISPPFEGHIDWVNAVAFSPDGQSVASGSGDKTVRLWTLQGNPISDPFSGHLGEVTGVAFSPDGEMVGSVSKDKTLRLWDLQANPVGLPFEGNAQWLTTVAFSPNGQTIASGSADRTLRLWNLEGRPIRPPLVGHTDQVLSVAFSPNGQTIASGSADGTVRLWDQQGNPIGEPFVGHSNWVTTVAFSPDGQALLSGSANGELRLWTLQGQPIGQPFGQSSAITSVAFSPDGQTIASGMDETVRLWTSQGESVSQPLEGHTDAILSVAFSPDGTTLVSGSVDETVRLWPISLVEQGWLTYTCDRLQGYLVVSQGSSQIAKEALRTCLSHR